MPRASHWADPELEPHNNRQPKSGHQRRRHTVVCGALCIKGVKREGDSIL